MNRKLSKALKRIICGIIMMGALALPLLSVAGLTHSRPLYVPNQAIVRLAPGSGVNDITGLLSEYGASRPRAWLNSQGRVLPLIPLSAIETRLSASTELSAMCSITIIIIRQPVPPLRFLMTRCIPYINGRWNRVNIFLRQTAGRYRWAAVI
jgi:hypothetical protein